MTNFYTNEGINPENDTYQKPSDWVGSTEISNFGTSGWTSTGEVTTFLRETLPPTHLENCRNIHYEPNPNAEYPNSVGTFDCKSREIVIRENVGHLPGKENKFESLTHQVAYNAYENTRLNRPDLIEQWSDLHNKSLERSNRDGLGFVSSHANTSAREDFAETFTTYVHDGEKLKFYNPEKYEFMKQELFSAREYPTASLSNITHNPHAKISYGSLTSDTKEAEKRLPVAILIGSPQTNAVSPVENRLPKLMGVVGTTLPPLPKSTIRGTDQTRNSLINPENRDP
jgi:hypothetical protein